MVRAAVESQTGKKITKFELQMDKGEYNGYIVYFEDSKPVVGAFDKSFKPDVYQ
jgi:hypothetical protein